MTITLGLTDDEIAMLGDLSWHNDAGPINESWQSTIMEALGVKIRDAMSATVSVVFVLRGNHVRADMTQQAADQIMDTWSDYVHGKCLPDTKIIGDRGRFVVLLSEIIGIYATPMGPTAQDRIASVLEKQANDGDDWKDQ